MTPVMEFLRLPLCRWRDSMECSLTLSPRDKRPDVLSSSSSSCSAPRWRLVTPVMEFLRPPPWRWLDSMECALLPLPSALVPSGASPSPLFALCTDSNAHSTKSLCISFRTGHKHEASPGEVEMACTPHGHAEGSTALDRRKAT